jgi:tetratricopeptide (TPR) repeat protein
MEKNGLYQTNSWLPDGNVYNHLTFEMNQQKSIDFLNGKRRFPELIQLSDAKLMKNQDFVDTLGKKLFDLRFEMEDYYSYEALYDYFMSLGGEFAQNKLFDLAYKVYYVGSQMFPELSYFYEAQADIYLNRRIKNVDLLNLLNNANNRSDNSFYIYNAMDIKALMAYYLIEEAPEHKAIEMLDEAIKETDYYQDEFPQVAINLQKARAYRILTDILLQYEISEVVLSDYDFAQISPLDAIDMAIQLDSLNPEYYFKRAQMHYENGLYHKAKSDLDRTIYLSPYNPIYFRNRGKINKDLGDVEGSKKDKEMFKSLKKWRRQMGITD